MSLLDLTSNKNVFLVRYFKSSREVLIVEEEAYLVTSSEIIDSQKQIMTTPSYKLIIRLDVRILDLIDVKEWQKYLDWTNKTMKNQLTK